MDADKTVTANFKKIWTLRVEKSPSAGGAVAGSIVSEDGTVLKSGVIDCGTDCAETVDSGALVKLAATPATSALPSVSSYRFDSWSSNCTADATDDAKCKVTVDAAKTVTATFAEVLRVDAGGPYQAAKAPGRRFYTVSVRATASGGVSPYSYAWEDKSANSRSATYMFGAPNGARLYGKKVTVTDADGDTATDTATITVTPSLGGFSDEFAYAVPLGGALSLVWGGGGSVAATSGDAGIASVSVSGAEIVVSGVSAGRADIAVRAGQEEFRVPVRVGGGG